MHINHLQVPIKPEIITHVSFNGYFYKGHSYNLLFEISSLLLVVMVSQMCHRWKTTWVLALRYAMSGPKALLVVIRLLLGSELKTYQEHLLFPCARAFIQFIVRKYWLLQGNGRGGEFNKPWAFVAVDTLIIVGIYQRSRDIALFNQGCNRWLHTAR